MRKEHAATPAFETSVSSPAAPPSIPPGAKLLSPKSTHEKFGRRKSWLWQILRDDPSFPRPVRLNGRPLWIESELDAYIATMAARRA
jgi:predicted DNA-binding transcriptional regulator AlpA